MHEDRYQHALARVTDEVRTEFASYLLGILWAGSVAAGTPFAGSDLDLYIIIRPDWRQRRLRQVEGVEVDLFVNPVTQIRAEFALTDHPATIAMFAHGRILYDPEGVMATLVEEARQIWQQGRPSIPPDALWRVRYMPVDLLGDTRDLLDHDAAAASYLIGQTLAAALDAHYRIQRRWTVKPKYLLADLEEHAPELAALVRRVLDGDLPVATRYDALALLVERVLAPLGGPAREWQSPREPVPPE